jgi:hypothetical protein
MSKYTLKISWDIEFDYETLEDLRDASKQIIEDAEKLGCRVDADPRLKEEENG